VSEWKTEKLAQTFLRDVRGAIPGAQLQFEILTRIVSKWSPGAGRILDLGCGDGILGDLLRSLYPSARLVLVDFSAPMLDAARKRLSHKASTVFITADFGDPSWVDRVADQDPFDIIVSGFSIHHQPDARKRSLYAEIYQLLAPAGVFLNLEHVSSSSRAVEELFDELFIDSLWEFHRTSANGQTRVGVAQGYYNRPDKEENILTPVEDQCEWLRSVGFTDVDCFLKIFELAVFGGRKPSVIRNR
jgi:SAM-dependent methyltransferase